MNRVWKAKVMATDQSSQWSNCLSFPAGIWNWYSQSLYRRVCKAATKCLFSASTGPEHSAFTNTGNFNSGFILSKHQPLKPSKFMYVLYIKSPFYTWFYCFLLFWQNCNACRNNIYEVSVESIYFCLIAEWSMVLIFHSLLNPIEMLPAYYYYYYYH